ncbi:MAG: hypothetical protein LBT54_07190, partial [Bifidobacteriaceae bacterium]|nr:hypothetical protein [Bifidobacteriaceae bacterium]
RRAGHTARLQAQPFLRTIHRKLSFQDGYIPRWEGEIELLDAADLPVGIAIRVEASAALKEYYADPSELMASGSVAAIVEGIVTGVGYAFEDEIAETRMTIAVNRTLRGKTKANIAVWEDGGIVRQAAVSAGSVKRFPDSRGNEPGPPAGSYMDVRFMGAPHPVVGDQVLLVLTDPKDVTRPGEYRLVSGPFGHFTLNSNGSYKRPSEFPVAESETDIKVAKARRMAMEASASDVS